MIKKGSPRLSLNEVKICLSRANSSNSWSRIKLSNPEINELVKIIAAVVFLPQKSDSDEKRPPVVRQAPPAPVAMKADDAPLRVFEPKEAPQAPPV